jgi:hypothetical protein
MLAAVEDTAVLEAKVAEEITMGNLVVQTLVEVEQVDTIHQVV